jgi:cytidyltransferase-like protein
VSKVARILPKQIMGVLNPIRDTVELEFASMHGRFQPFHCGHLRYALQVKARCHHLIVGITNPDRRHLTPHPADPSRHLAVSNPFSYYERTRMISASLRDAHLPVECFTIVPFPIDTPELIESYCPKVPVFLRDRGAWTAAKMSTLAGLGWTAQLIVDETDLDINGTDIRTRISEQKPWKHLVPPACAKVLEEIRGVERIVSLQTKLH